VLILLDSHNRNHTCLGQSFPDWQCRKRREIEARDLLSGILLLQMHETICRRRKLAQLDAGLLEDRGRFAIHAVSAAVDDLTDANLGNLDTARQTGAGIAVQDCAISDPLAAGFEQGVLFRVQAQAGAQAHPRILPCIAPRTASLAAILQAPRRAVVARADDALLPHEHAAHAALHAVAALRRQRCQLHEVLIPARPQAVLVGEI